MGRCSPGADMALATVVIGERWHVDRGKPAVWRFSSIPSSLPPGRTRTATRTRPAGALWASSEGSESVCVSALGFIGVHSTARESPAGTSSREERRGVTHARSSLDFGGEGGAF